MDFIKGENRFFAEDSEGLLLAEITFSETVPGVVNIDKTYVHPSQRGKGLADALVSKAAESILNDGKKPTATCSYAKHWLEKNGL